MINQICLHHRKKLNYFLVFYFYTQLAKPTRKMNTNLPLKITTLHFNFSEPVINHLSYFAELHKHDDRKTFKSQWEHWIQTPEISKLIQAEIEYQHKKGFTNDVLDKMFKSVRYYFRKKTPKPDEKTQRKQYITLSSNFLETIDNHAVEIIKSHSVINNNNTLIANISPANAYTHFCETHQTIIYDQIKYLVNILTYDDICEKMKKTYKNRFHLTKTEMEKKYGPNVNI